MIEPTRIALIGYGRIARTEHRPSIDASAEFELVATVDPLGSAPGLPHFVDLDSLLAAGLDVDAVAMCQPPTARYVAARRALRAGLHVLLEKPPGASVAEIETLEALARHHGRTLFAAWHSRFAPALPPAHAWLEGRRVRSVDVTWYENVTDWHPGQRWIWDAGGFGVFDAGINALSILTFLLGERLRVMDGTLQVPVNAHTPVAAQLRLETADEAEVRMRLDWRRPGVPQWEIRILTDGGQLRISEGGARLWFDEVEQEVGTSREYAELYARFATLLRTGCSDVDASPLRVAADAFLRSRVQAVEAFAEVAS